jgi:hypothetical protein
LNAEAHAPDNLGLHEARDRKTGERQFAELSTCEHGGY